MSSGPEQARVTLEAWLVTDVGVVRDHNEDSAFMEASKGFFIVADGMGGHAAGEVASAMAVETVRRTLEGARDDIDSFLKAPGDAGRRSIVQLLQNAVLSAHQAVYQRGQSEQDKAGMGTTLDVVLVAGPEAFVAHVGDSRTYLIRDGKSSQITTDHTVAEVLVIEGKLTIEEAQVSPLRTILVNAIGVSADVGVEMAHVTLKRGDRLLLCSDGLHDYFPLEEEIAAKMSAAAPGDALKEMVELAKSRGGHDNITGVAVHVTEVVGVPAAVEHEATQPATPNPFAADEPTETAFVAPAVPTRPSPTATKATQPMRALTDDDDHDDGTAETIPPPSRARNPIERLPTEPPDKPTESAAQGGDDAKPDGVKPNRDKPDDTKPDGDTADGDKADGDSKDKAAKPDKPDKPDKKKKKRAKRSSKEPDSDDDSDGTPANEIATADTGRAATPKEPETN